MAIFCLFTSKFLITIKIINFLLISIFTIKFGIPFDQLMCIKCTTWRMGRFNSKKAILLSSLVILIFFFLNFHLNFTLKFDKQSGENETFIGLFENSNIMNYWLYVNYRFIKI